MRKCLANKSRNLFTGLCRKETLEEIFSPLIRSRIWLPISFGFLKEILISFRGNSIPWKSRCKKISINAWKMKTTVLPFPLPFRKYFRVLNNFKILPVLQLQLKTQNEGSCKTRTLLLTKSQAENSSSKTHIPCNARKLKKWP